MGGVLKRSHTILFSIRSSGEAGACEHKEAGLRLTLRLGVALPSKRQKDMMLQSGAVSRPTQTGLRWGLCASSLTAHRAGEDGLKTDHTPQLGPARRQRGPALAPPGGEPVLVWVKLPP